MTVESSWDRASREPLAAFAELSKIMLGDGSLNETLGQIAALRPARPSPTPMRCQ
jgi:hypothetical protein